MFKEFKRGYLIFCGYAVAVSFGNMLFDGGGLLGLIAAGILHYCIVSGPRWKEEREDREYEQRRQEEGQRAQIEQQRILSAEAKRQEQNKIAQSEAERLHLEHTKVVHDETAQRKLRIYFNELLKYAMMLPTKDGDESPLVAINESIDGLLLEQDIKPHHYIEQSIRNDKVLLLEHLEESGLSRHPIIRRLRTLLDTNDSSPMHLQQQPVRTQPTSERQLIRRNREK